jgi:hypothetical protein
MKKLFLIAASLIASIATFANYGETRLVVNGANSSNTRLVIDGLTVGNNYKNGDTYLITDISTASHRIQIIKQTTNLFGGNKEKIIYDQYLSLKPNYETSLTIATFGNVVYNETPINTGGWNGNNGNNNGTWNGDNNNGNNNGGYNNNGNWNGNNSQNTNGCGKKNGHKKHKGKKEKHDDDDDNSWNNNGNWNNKNSKNNSGTWNGS